MNLLIHGFHTMHVCDVPGIGNFGFMEIKTAGGWIPLAEFRPVLASAYLQRLEGKAYLVEPDKGIFAGEVHCFEVMFELH